MWRISRVKSAVIDFITGGHIDKQAQYGTSPTAPAAPGSSGTSTTPQTTTPAPQPPAGMTCPAGQTMMLDPQTNQWKCMPETTAQLQPLPARAPVLKKLPERVEKTEMVMTPVGPRPARVIGEEPTIIARISERFIMAQELAILQDLAADNFGVALSNDQSVDLLRWLWKYRITSPEEKVGKIGEWLTLKGLASTLVREPIAKKIASQTGRAEIYAKIYIDKEELEYDDRVQAILKSNVSDEEKATQIEGVVYEMILEKMQNKEIDIKDWSIDSTKDIDYDFGEIQRIIQEHNEIRDLDNAQDQEFGEGGKKEGQLTDLMESHVDPHADVFDWAVETYGPEDIIKKLEIEDNGEINLENYKDQVTQNYLPSYEEQIKSSDFDELFDRKDPVIEEQEYDSEKDLGDKWLGDDEEDIYIENNDCGIDEVDSGLTADKFGNKEAQYKFSIGDRVLFKATKDGRVKSGVIINMFSRQAIIKADDGTTTQVFVWNLLREAMQKNAQGLPQQLTWVWDDKLGDWKQVPVMSEWDTLMERRLQRQGQKKAKLSGRKGQTQQLKIGDTLKANYDNSDWEVVRLGEGDESVYIRPLGEQRGMFKIWQNSWQTNYRLMPPNFKKAQTQAQMEKTVPADVTPVNPAPAINRAEPLKQGEVPVILEDEDEGTVKPKGKTEEESQKEKQVDLSREEKVKKDVETLRDNIINLANSVYSIEMSDNQVTDLMGKVMGFLSESISEVTLGRVQDIVGDLLPRKARLSSRVGQRINKIWQVGILDNGKYRQIDIELGPESDKQDVIEELKRRGERGEILSIVTDAEKRLSNRK